MPDGAKLCFAGTLVSLLVAIRNVMNPPEGSDLVPYAVGSFLIPVALLIWGLKIWEKSRTRQDDDSKPPK